MSEREAPATGTGSVVRCPWASGADRSLLTYHDAEWGVPVHRDRRHFEFLILEGAQAGLSWTTILRKRREYSKAFDRFDPRRIAAYSPARVRRLMRNAGIVRNRLKILSAVRNARVFLAVQKEFGSFDDYVWTFVGGRPIQNRRGRGSPLPARSPESDALSADLRLRGMNFVGSTIVYAYLQAVGLVNDHLPDCFRYSEVEQLALAAAGPRRR